MKEERSEAVIFAEWILENAYQTMLEDEIAWDYNDVAYSSRDLYIEFINDQR